MDNCNEVYDHLQIQTHLHFFFKQEQGQITKILRSYSILYISHVGTGTVRFVKVYIQKTFFPLKKHDCIFGRNCTYLKGQSHQIRLALKWYNWIGLHKYYCTYLQLTMDTNFNAFLYIFLSVFEKLSVTILTKFMPINFLKY